MAVLPERHHLRPALPRSGARRSVRPAQLGAGAERRRPDGGATAAQRPGGTAGAGGRAEAPGRTHHGEAGSGGRARLALRGADGLPLRAGGGAARVPLHDAADGGLLRAEAGGGPAAHGGGPASAAVPGRARHPAERRPDRHGPADQPDPYRLRPARPGLRGRRDVGRTGSAGRDDRDARRAESARGEGRRFTEPARQPAAGDGRAPGAERPAAERGAHAVHDGGLGEHRHGEPGHHPAVRCRAWRWPGARDAGAGLRVPGRGAARRRAVRGRGGPAQGPLRARRP